MLVRALRGSFGDYGLVRRGQVFDVTASQARQLAKKTGVFELVEQEASPAAADPFPGWWPDWRGDTVIIVASGPSSAESPLAEAKGLTRVIAINNSWRLAPWCDVLYACDHVWWQANAGMPDFKGIKISQDVLCASTPSWGVNLVTMVKDDDRLQLGQPGVIGWGGNSGFHALNLAVQFGAAKIILVGYDMRLDKGLHWHGKHGRGLSNPTRGSVDRWRRVVDEAAETIAGLGIKAINCSPVSALTDYPKMSLMEALAC